MIIMAKNPQQNGRANPKGHAKIELADGTMRLRLGFSELADADEYLGRSLVSSITSDPLNFHTIRVAFYFAARMANKNLRIRSVKEAGRMLEGTDLETISTAIMEALRAGGTIPEEDIEEPDEEEVLSLSPEEPTGEA